MNRVPGDAVSADNDPVILAGIQKLTGKQEFPVLLSRLTKELITGWKEEEYKRVVAVYSRIYGSSTDGLSVDGKPVVEEGSETSTTNLATTS